MREYNWPRLIGYDEWKTTEPDYDNVDRCEECQHPISDYCSCSCCNEPEPEEVTQ